MGRSAGKAAGPTARHTWWVGTDGSARLRLGLLGASPPACVISVGLHQGILSCVVETHKIILIIFDSFMVCQFSREERAIQHSTRDLCVRTPHHLDPQRFATSSIGLELVRLKMPIVSKAWEIWEINSNLCQADVNLAKDGCCKNPVNREPPMPKLISR